MIQKLKFKINQQDDCFHEYKNLVSKEMEVKDLIYNRNLNYCDTLKKELVFAKNVIKNPEIFKDTNRKMKNHVRNLSLYQVKESKKSKAGGTLTSKGTSGSILSVSS